MQDVGADTVTTEQALRWATLPSTADPRWWAEWLAVVRGFARYLQTLDPTVLGASAYLLALGRA